MPCRRPDFGRQRFLPPGVHVYLERRRDDPLSATPKVVPGSSGHADVVRSSARKGFAPV
jgi:hypothetical protein